jgi:hypothetical protein
MFAKLPSCTPVVMLLVLAACSGGSKSAPTPTGPQTTTFSGTASINGTGGCSGVTHAISTGAGTLTVTLVQASAARVAMQVCHPTAVNHATECTVPPFANVAVGGVVTATLKGGQAQVITVFPEGCGGAGTQPATTVTYTISATYPG